VTTCQTLLGKAQPGSSPKNRAPCLSPGAHFFGAVIELAIELAQRTLGGISRHDSITQLALVGSKNLGGWTYDSRSS
jgi:hypothetical protein